MRGRCDVGSNVTRPRQRCERRLGAVALFSQPDNDAAPDEDSRTLIEATRGRLVVHGAPPLETARDGLPHGR